MSYETFTFVLAIFGLVLIGACCIIAIVFAGNVAANLIERMNRRTKIRGRYGDQLFEAKAAARFVETKRGLDISARALGPIDGEAVLEPMPERRPWEDD